jgi:predicted RNA binding protein YcfA (HicA-like mRNA interferase family)
VSKRIPALKPGRIIRTLLKAGFVIHHQTGSHIRLKHPEKPETLTFARHDRFEVPHIITQKLLRRARLTEEEFLNLL